MGHTRQADPARPELPQTFLSRRNGMLAALRASDRKERITRAVFGAAFGFLIAMALVVANLPIMPGANAETACAIAALLGAVVALAVPLLWITLLAAVAAIAVFMVAFAPITASRVHAWIRRDPLPVTAPDAVVALSTTITVDGFVDATGTTRLLSALEVMRRTGARMLITTRPSQTPAVSIGVVTRDYQRLIGLAGDTSRWRMVGPVATTHDEAVATSRLLAPASTHSIVVVTSPLHSRRACATFEALGFTVTCWPADERRYAVNTFSGLRTRLAATADLVYERAAVVEYRWRGWIH